MQWDSPNVWAPNNWIMHEVLAEPGRIKYAQQWVSTVYCSWKKQGLIYEKYRNDKLGERGQGGEYAVQAGFGWTNGLALYYLSLYGDVLQVPSCPWFYKPKFIIKNPISEQSPSQMWWLPRFPLYWQVVCPSNNTKPPGSPASTESNQTKSSLSSTPPFVGLLHSDPSLFTALLKQGHGWNHSNFEGSKRPYCEGSCRSHFLSRWLPASLSILDDQPSRKVLETSSAICWIYV